MDLSIKSQTFQLIYDYALFRLHVSAVKESRLKAFPLPNPCLLSKKMRYLGLKFSNEITEWVQFNQKDISVSDYENWRTMVHAGFNECENISPRLVFAYFEFVSVCGVFAVSTPVNGPNVKDICDYATEYLCNSNRFMQFLFKQNGWQGFIHTEYMKHRAPQEQVFKQWLQMFSTQE